MCKSMISEALISQQHISRTITWHTSLMMKTQITPSVDKITGLKKLHFTNLKLTNHNSKFLNK